MDDKNTIERDLIRVIDSVLQEFWPMLEKQGFKVVRGDQIQKFHEHEKRYASEATISILEKSKETNDFTHFVYGFDVFLYFKGEPKKEEEIRETMAAEFEAFYNHLKKLNRRRGKQRDDQQC